jgi:hypothetical protein
VSNGNRDRETPKPIPNLEAKPVHDMCVLPSGGKSSCCLAFLCSSFCLVCEEIFNKIKTELITQAMDTVKEAIDSKMMDVKGSLINLPDKASDTELYMFLISQILEQRENIVKNYEKYLNGVDYDKLSPEMLQQVGRLRKFILYIDKIAILMDYGSAFDSWMNDVAMEIREKDPSKIIRDTMNDSRIELISFVLKNQTIAKEEILTEKERKFLERALA